MFHLRINHLYQNKSPSNKIWFKEIPTYYYFFKNK